MRKKKKKSAARLNAEKNYKKERDRLIKFYKRGVERGIRFDFDFIPENLSVFKNVHTNTLKKKIRELKKISKEFLYEHSSGLDEFGHIVSGTKAMKSRRKMLYEERRKGREKSKEVDIEVSVVFVGDEGEEGGYNEHKYSSGVGDEYQDTVSVGDIENGVLTEDGVNMILYYRLFDMIDDFILLNPIGGKYLVGLINNKINDIGFKNFCRMVESISEEEWAEIQWIMEYYTNLEPDDGSMVRLVELILGREATLDDVKNF